MDVEPITEVPTRQDILDAIRYMTDTAKMLRRQGYVGIYGQSSARLHGRIDGLLYDLAALDLEAIVGEQASA